MADDSDECDEDSWERSHPVESRDTDWWTPIVCVVVIWIAMRCSSWWHDARPTSTATLPDKHPPVPLGVSDPCAAALEKEAASWPLGMSPGMWVSAAEIAIAFSVVVFLGFSRMLEKRSGSTST